MSFSLPKNDQISLAHFWDYFTAVLNLPLLTYGHMKLAFGLIASSLFNKILFSVHILVMVAVHRPQGFPLWVLC